MRKSLSRFGLSVGKQRVLVDPRLGHAGDRNGANRRVQAVVPVVPRIEAHLVAKILIDTAEELIDVVLVGTIRLKVVRGPRAVGGRIELEQILRDRRDL
jgi:hypothetical protein